MPTAAEYPDAIAAYDKIAQATAVLAAQAVRYSVLEGAQGFNCDSFRLARTLLRAGEERPKPNGERLREYSDSGKVSLELALFSEKPIYTDMEILTLSDSLTFLVAELGATNDLVQKILAGKSPRDRAVELINTTKVRDVALRKRLYEGGAGAVTAARRSDDRTGAAGRSARPRLAQSCRGTKRNQTTGPRRLARARNAMLGNAGYPDATFTLRLSFGTVKGYEEEGKPVARHHHHGRHLPAGQGNEQPSAVRPPAALGKAQIQLNLSTPLNFVSTATSSAATPAVPVVNRAGEFVGIIFDGNLEGLPWDYAFSDKQGRATSVASPAILEALNKVYQAKDLAKELVTGHRAR